MHFFLNKHKPKRCESFTIHQPTLEGHFGEGWNGGSEKDLFTSESPAPTTMALLGNRVFADVTKQRASRCDDPGPRGQALSPYETQKRRDAQRKSHTNLAMPTATRSWER